MLDWDLFADDASFWAFVNVLRLSDWVTAASTAVLLAVLLQRRMVRAFPFLTALAGVLVVDGLNKVSLLDLSGHQAVALMAVGWVLTVLALADLGAAIERSGWRLVFRGAVAVTALVILGYSRPMVFPTEDGDPFAMAKGVFFGSWLVLFVSLAARCRLARPASTSLACLFLAQVLPGIAGSLGLLLTYLDVVMTAAALLAVAATVAMLRVRALVPTSV